jgi:D-arabinose 1-dehydrogenase-like Zn-dependent alcohol dehydrogenase
MRSQQIVEWGRPLEGRDYPDPEPRGTEVLVRVRACGVCHTDLHLREGHFDLGGGERLRVEDRGVRLPFTMGHEVAGEVAALGPDARDQGVAVSDRAVVYPGSAAAGARRAGAARSCSASRRGSSARGGTAATATS